MLTFAHSSGLVRIMADAKSFAALNVCTGSLLRSLHMNGRRWLGHGRFMGILLILLLSLQKEKLLLLFAVFKVHCFPLLTRKERQPTTTRSQIKDAWKTGLVAVAVAGGGGLQCNEDDDNDSSKKPLHFELRGRKISATFPFLK